MNVGLKKMNEWASSESFTRKTLIPESRICGLSDVDILRKSENSPIEWQDRLALVTP